MNTEGLKKIILAIIGEVKANKTFPATMREQVPMQLLLIKTGASLEEMKKAVDALVDEKIILFYSNDWITNITKYINQNLPVREVLSKQPTKDELFVCGWVVEISK